MSDAAWNNFAHRQLTHSDLRRALIALLVHSRNGEFENQLCFLRAVEETTCTLERENYDALRRFKQNKVRDEDEAYRELND